MNRRRMMMLQKTQTDNNLLYLFEDYKQSWNSAYTIDSLWNGNVVTLRHTRSNSFYGPNSAAMCYIGDSQKASTGSSSVYEGLKALPVLNSLKRHRLILTVINVTKNTAVDETSGVIWFSFGTTNKVTYIKVNICDIKVGTQIVVENETAGAIKGAVISSDAPGIQWSFDFDVKVEEVE